MATFTVATQSQLNSALNNASSGDTIRLQSGSYDLQMTSSRQSNFDFGREVTITSANASRPAEIKEMYLRGVENVKFSNLVFDYERDGSVSRPLQRDKKFFVEESSGVTFDNVKFDGEVRNGYGTGLGLRMKSSDDITIRNSEFVNLLNGLTMDDMRDVTISGNTIRGMAIDGMRFGGIDGAVIEDNVFRDFHSSRNQKHKDAIQFHTAGKEAASRDIIIRDNVINNPEETHGIYFGNGRYSSGDRNAYYRDITITDNELHTAHKLAIAVQHGDGVTIRGNTLTHNKADGFTKQVNIPLISVSLESRNVSITNNDVAAVQREQSSSWNISGNDTGGGSLQFWEGLPAGVKAPRAFAVDAGIPADSAARSASSVSDILAKSAEPIELRVKGSNTEMKAKDGLVVDSLDFDRGDHFVFTQFNDRTFRDKNGGNSVNDFNDGAAVRIDSILDLRELVAFSPAIKAEVDRADDTLTLKIDQGRDGVSTVSFEGMGHAYLEAAALDHLF